MIRVPRVVIGGTHSGAGKTTVATAPAFARRFVGACSDYRTRLQPQAELSS